MREYEKRIMLKSKDDLCHEILKQIGFGAKSSIYSEGNFNKKEVLTIYRYIKAQKMKERRRAR